MTACTQIYSSVTATHVYLHHKSKRSHLKTHQTSSPLPFTGKVQGAGSELLTPHPSPLTPIS